MKTNKSRRKFRKAREKKQNPNNIALEIKLLKEQIKSLKEDIRPFVLEREAVLESRDRFLVSCDASWTKNAAAIAFVMRSIAFKEIYKVSRPTNARTSNESELDAIYAALDCIASMHIHTVNKDNRIKYIEIRSDSQLCINWITGRRNCYIEKIKNKIQVIRDVIKGVESLSGKSIKMVWRKRNSTHDLNTANEYAQTLNGVKVS